MTETLTLSTVQTHLSDALSDLSSARKALQYSVGDKQVVRSRIAALERDIAHWRRIEKEMLADNSGVDNPGYMVPEWS